MDFIEKFARTLTFAYLHTCHTYIYSAQALTLTEYYCNCFKKTKWKENRGKAAKFRQIDGIRIWQICILVTVDKLFFSLTAGTQTVSWTVTNQWVHPPLHLVLRSFINMPLLRQPPLQALLVLTRSETLARSHHLAFCPQAALGRVLQICQDIHGWL